ncbi:hypothetical protein COO91_06175 [Nostoc flagelliforme CCNUN1]|uniref:Uncharacterized protein n=1 Tax=Nostoc flagelliforme CCNUN1 TaxID=2038116 RepID=A0A2K8SXJ2_9NOSO|nr:hypothetical protein COO91_06175 [Nostoc flagelliforme CCNUN1]
MKNHRENTYLGIGNWSIINSSSSPASPAPTSPARRSVFSPPIR